MLKLIKLVLIGIGLGFSSEVIAHDSQSSTTQNEQHLEYTDKRGFFDQMKDTIGINYFTFLYGPGLHPDNLRVSPNHLGNPENDGISTQNQVSIRYKFSTNLALDFQSRFRIILNNGVDNDKFQHFRWESPRIGLSGKLISGKDWSLTGAVNTDFPYFLPTPLAGYQAQQRTIIFNPGMFASFRYEPAKSRWSVFSVVSPRYFFHSNINAAEDQLRKSGLIPGNKPELIIAFQPTISYQLISKLKITIGSNIDYRKHVVSNWNPFNASLISNGDNPAWRLSPVPIILGTSYSFSTAITVFPFISCFPVAIQRKDGNELTEGQKGRQASFIESASFGMWVNGTIF